MDTVLNKRELYLGTNFLIGYTLASITRIFLKLHTWLSLRMLWQICMFGSDLLKMKGSSLGVQIAFLGNSKMTPLMKAE
jgi:hypothetical protein